MESMTGDFITIDSSKCKRCNACRRVCPTKATKVEASGQKVLRDLCIGCGSCIAACSQKARQLADVTKSLETLLASGTAAAILDPTYVLAFPRARRGQLEAGLRAIGFSSVVASGAACRLVVSEYAGLLRAPGMAAASPPGASPVISSCCPAVVALVEKHYPHLVGALAPIVSWPLAAARLARGKASQDAKFVYVAPCEARSMEALERAFGDEIELVVTFGEIEQALTRHDVLLTELEPAGEQETEWQDSYALPLLPGGLTAALAGGSGTQPSDPWLPGSVVAAGAQRCMEVIDEIARDKVRVTFVDGMFCRGCIDAPALRQRLTLSERRCILLSSWRDTQPGRAGGARDACPTRTGPAFDMSRSFRDRSARLPVPRDAEIADLLALCGILSPDQELNCGACGFSSCRARAIAIYRGLEPAEECLMTSGSRVERPGDVPGAAGQSRTTRPGARGGKHGQGDTEGPFGAIYGSSGVIKLARIIAEKAARTNSTVLLTGESGTGKEVFARAIHDAGARREGPFVAVNSAAIPHTLMESELFGYEAGAFTGAARGGMRGKIEHASGGTLFLDEVGDMSFPLQAKLLRVLQDHRVQRVGGSREVPVDVRVIAATNKNLKDMVENGTFRDDLYYRLNVVGILIPSLRDRRGDIPEIVRRSLAKLNAACGTGVHSVSPEALSLLVNYDWPGNVRELENVLERALNLAEGSVIYPEHLPHYIVSPAQTAGGVHAVRAGGSDLESLLACVERETVRQVLQECNHNKVLAARRLGISRSTLYEKLLRHNLLPRNRDGKAGS